MKELIRGRGLVIVKDELTGKLLLKRYNAITSTFRDRFALWLTGSSINPPGYIALGNDSPLSTEHKSNFTALKKEFSRIALTSKSRQGSDIARLVAIFTSNQGLGTTTEMGLFDAAEDINQLHNCESTTDWTTGGLNTLGVSTTEYREGAGSLQCNGTNNVRFRNELLSLGATGKTESDYFQIWYYADISFMGGDNLLVEISSSTSDNTDEYEFSIAKSSLSDGWNFLQWQISEGTKTGSPDLDNIVRIRVLWDASSADAAIDYIDSPRLFSKNGNLFAYVEPTQTITKTPGQIFGVYWYLSMIEGGATMAYTAFAKEQLTISTLVVTLTSGIYAPAGADQARAAIITVVSGGPIRYWYNGDDPTSTTGHKASEGDYITLDDATDIANFKAIRDSTAGTDATVAVTYER
jgi:hypothetical protein